MLVSLPASMIVVATMAVLGLLPLMKNYRNQAFLFFSGLCFSLAGWVITNHLTDLDQQNSLLWTQATFLSIILGLFLFLLFVNNFPREIIKSRWLKGLFLLGCLGMVWVATQPEFIPYVELQGGVSTVVTGPWYWTFLVYFVLYFGTTLGLLIYNRLKLPPQEAVKVKYILVGILLMGLIGGATNILLPLFTGENTYATLGTYSTVIFAGFTYYAIIRHRLFDIRLIIARTFAYALVVMTLGLIYGFIVFGLIDRYLPGAGASTLHQTAYTVLAVFLAFSFQPLKRFFDKLTDRIFYQDSYETSDVLSDLGRVLISKVNDFELLDESLKLIVDTLKVTAAKFVVLKQGEVYRTASFGNMQDRRINPAAFVIFKSAVTTYDELEEFSAARQILRSYDIYAVVRLATNEDLIGYLLLGGKQNGTMFTHQDTDLLEIISQELAMAIQNASNYEEIASFGKTMQREVMEATAKLRENNQRLVKLDEAKDEFISMASHQLRTPLTTVKGYLSMLLEGDAGKLSKKQADFIDLAFVSSERMVHLIADMLNVSRISTGRLTLDVSKFDLVTLVKEEAQQLKRQAEARRVKLKLHLPKKPVEVMLDETKIRQVVMNFTDNAIYYAPEGEVNVYVEQQDETVEFRVEDNGIGVSEEAKKQLFTKFFRAENAQSVRPDGTGLGLYMAKQVIEAQDGEVIFTSQEGEGSTFGFRFAARK